MKKIYFVKVMGSQPGHALSLLYHTKEEAKNAFHTIEMLIQTVVLNDIHDFWLEEKEV